MAKFTGTFVQLVEITYQFEVEADTKEEALKKVEDDPFKYRKISKSYDGKGRGIKDIEFEEAI